jgi:hypothetical protein
MNTPISNNTWTPDAQAIAIKDGTIIAIGSPEAVNAFKKVSTEVVDLNGTWAIKWPWNALVLRKTVKIQRATLFTVIKMVNQMVPCAIVVWQYTEKPCLLFLMSV